MTSKKTEENPYFKSFSKLEAMNSDEAKELLAEVKEFIEDELMPSYNISPELISYRPSRHFNSTVFPEPLCPIIRFVFPLSNEVLISLSTSD